MIYFSYLCTIVEWLGKCQVVKRKAGVCNTLSAVATRSPVG